MNIDKIIKEEVKRIVSETSRRQKATQSFLGKRGNIKTFCIITAENPMGVKTLPSENKKRYNELTDFLSSHQFVYFPVKGKYGSVEHSLMIYNISLEACKNIGKRFNQESFIYANVKDNSVIFSYYQKNGDNSPYNKIEDIEKYVDTTENDDFFTAIGRNFKFTIPFKIFESHIDKINSIITERCKNENYKNNYKVWLSESVNDNKTLYSQRFKRAKLWGKNYLMLMNI